MKIATEELSESQMAAGDPLAQFRLDSLHPPCIAAPCCIFSDPLTSHRTSGTFREVTGMEEEWGSRKSEGKGMSNCACHDVMRQARISTNEVERVIRSTYLYSIFGNLVHQSRAKRNKSESSVLILAPKRNIIGLVKMRENWYESLVPLEKKL
uniref:Uncharacterized protein n=1 Tax=Vespula pensylvanica TaxID=30213 RepID=A0A834PC74_VESPE|nr:hypothetical protein H0235_003070 [Vespula pensylvanica]